MSAPNKVYQLLGLARRAGGVAPGAVAVRHAIREGEARVVLFAGDASSAQLDKIRRTLAGRHVPQVSLGDRSALGAALGMAPLSAVAVTNESLAEQVLAELGRSEATTVPAGAEA